MVLALCNSPHDPLSVYHVSFNSLVYCQRYAPDKLFMANNKKGSNSVNTGYRVMVLALCIFLMTLYQCNKFHLIPLYTFRDMLWSTFSVQKLKRKVTP